MNTAVAEQVISRASKALNSIGARWWITDGTLLGWHREGGGIPHDTDVDIGVWIQDVAPVYPEFLRAMLRQGFRRGNTWGSLDVGLEISWRFKRTKLDIFFYYPDFERPGGVWSSAWSSHMIKYLYKEADLFDLQTVTYNNTPAFAPANVENWVTTKYGENWRTPVKKWDWAYGPKNARRSSLDSIKTGKTLTMLTQAEIDAEMAHRRHLRETRKGNAT